MHLITGVICGYHVEEIENPLTRQDVAAKFLGLTGTVLGEENARAAIDEVSLLDTRDSMAPLLATLKLSE